MPAVQTDGEGNFQIAGLPPSMRIALGVEHDDFVRQTVFAATTDQPQPNLVARFFTGDQEQSMSFPVQTGKLAVKLQPGCRLSGGVTYGDSGKPVAPASSWSPAPSGIRRRPMPRAGLPSPGWPRRSTRSWSTHPAKRATWFASSP